MGVSEDKIVITVNNWGNDCKWYSDNLPPEFRGVQFTVANKSNLIAGSNSVEFMQSDVIRLKLIVRSVVESVLV
jgi:hypothetical protein